MSVTVQEVLALPFFQSAIVVAGRSGLKNQVRWVHITEIIDVSRFLKGSELLLTHGIFLKDQPESVLRRFVQELAAVPCAALIFELGRALREVPAAVAEEADRAGLPVIAVTREMHFIEVTETVYSLIVNRQYVHVQRALQTADAFMGILLRQEGVPALLKSLHKTVMNPVLYIAREENGPFYSYPPQPVSVALAVRSSADRLALRGREWPVHRVPIRLMDELWGELCLLEQRPINEMTPIIMERAAEAVAVELIRLKTAEHARRVIGGDLLEEMIMGALPPVEAQRRAQALGIEVGTRPMAVILASEPLRAVPAGWLVSGRRVLAVAAQPSGLEEAIRRLHAQSGLRLSVSGIYTHLDSIPAAFAEAQAVERLQAIIPRQGMVRFFREMGPYRLLATAPTDALHSLVQDELGAVLVHKGAPLFETLRVLIDADYNMAETARRLVLTRQTLYKRLERLHELTGRRLDDPEGRLALALAVRASLYLTNCHTSN